MAITSFKAKSDDILFLLSKSLRQLIYKKINRVIQTILTCKRVKQANIWYFFLEKPLKQATV